MADWVKIKAEYIRGGISYREISKKYNVSFSQVKRRALTEKWYTLKTQAAEKATTKIVEDAASQIAERNKRISQVADKLLDAICEGIDAGIFTVSTKGIREIAASLKDIKEIQGIRSDADMREQEARINKLVADSKRDEQVDQTVRVVLSPEAEELSG